MHGESRGLRYVLITPARNEEVNIERAIRSMVKQTLLPAKWVIVDDGSTDGTREIVRQYSSRHPWLKLVRVPEHADRSFSAKVRAFRLGLESIGDTPYDIVGNLDADISFEPDYFEFLSGKFVEDPELGVAGTPFVEPGFRYDYRFTNIEHVSGACQLFRRRCYQEIGGYTPVARGGIDWIAVTTARMKGWKTRTFPERICLHHRPIGTGSTNAVKALFRQGQKDYFLGGHPVWQLFRTLYQIRNRPRLIGAVLLLAGYSWAALTLMERPIPAELIDFNRREQMARLRRFAAKLLPMIKDPATSPRVCRA